jgi:zinc/manganese transport system permease protein
MSAQLHIYDLLVAPFAEFAFMRRALAGSIALAIVGPPLGVFLILRRMALTGDAMAHAILPGAALGYLVAGLSLGPMTIGGLAAGLIVAAGSGVVARATILREDASLAAFYLISLALGVTIVSLRGSNIDLLHVLFGSVLALDDATLILLAAIASVTLIALAALYRPLVLETVDAGFLTSVSRSGGFVQIGFLALVVLNLVGSFQALGTLLAVGMMMLPAASAMLMTDDMTLMIVAAALQGMLAGYAGLVISFHAGLPSGPLIILVAGGIYLLALIFGPAGGLLRRLKPRRHLEA